MNSRLTRVFRPLQTPAGLIALVVKTQPGAGAKGTSIIMVETEGLKGYRVGRILDKMGMKSQDTAELFFEDVRVPAANLLGGVEGQGFYQLMRDLPYERALIAVTGVAGTDTQTSYVYFDVRSPVLQSPTALVIEPGARS